MNARNLCVFSSDGVFGRHTHKKMVQATGSHLTYASFALPQDTDMGTVYIGYSYIDDDGNEEIYWFPEEEILDGDTGAVEYVPLSS